MIDADAPLAAEQQVPARVAVVQGSQTRVELCSLVLLAVNISHRVVRGPAGWSLQVRPEQLQKARYHLAAFEDENRHWPPVATGAPVVAREEGGWGVMTILAGLMAFHALTGPWTADNSWFSQGAVESRLIVAGHEPWRVVTGLTLHADISHLVGNIALGGCVLLFLAGLTGNGGVWFLALLTGALGNYCNALYHGGEHRFVGFSTAVFGVIGCLSGIRMVGSRSPRALLLPLGAGAGLLAMLGTEGEKTDVGAHLWGLGVGVVCGLCWQGLQLGRRWHSGPSQALLGVGSVLVVLASWWLAVLK